MELIDMFKMSPATIRNDLRELETAELIKRTHGGAIPADSVRVGFELDATRKIVKNQSLKEIIAKKAASLIEDGDIVILDTGTTTLEMAAWLHDKKNLTVIVNDLQLALALEKYEHIHVVVVGGSLRKGFHCTVGPLAINLLKELNVDKVFLGTNCFTVSKGCTTPDINQAEVKKMMMHIANQTILLCDSTKIGKNSFIQFARAEDIDLLITDSLIAPVTLEEIGALGIEVAVEAIAG